MKNMLGSAILGSGVFALATMSVQADHHMEMQFNPTELMTCSYKEGQDREDLDDLTDAFTKWIKKNDPDYTYYLLSPVFHEGADWDFGMLGSWSSGAGMGKGYDAWMKDDDDVGAMFEEVMDCDNSLAAVTPIAVPEEGGPWERGVVWFQRCEMEDEATLGDVVAANRKMVDAMTEMGEMSASWVFLPALGMGDPEFDYYHVQAWPSYSALGIGFDGFFNKGGWKLQAEVNEVSECASPNLYNYRMVHSPE